MLLQLAPYRRAFTRFSVFPPVFLFPFLFLFSCAEYKGNHVESRLGSSVPRSMLCDEPRGPKALISGGRVGDFTASGHLIKSRSINPGGKGRHGLHSAASTDAAASGEGQALLLILTKAEDVKLAGYDFHPCLNLYQTGLL